MMQSLYNKMSSYKFQLEILINNIDKIQADISLSSEMKLTKIKIIKEEIINISNEIDKVKKELMILNSYKIN